MSQPVITVEQLSHLYGDRHALDHVSFEIPQGDVFGLLGPNGGGKTTLFRILSTLLPLQQGSAIVAGANVKTQAHQVRRNIGVTFQSPSLDVKLTVRENLKHQGHLYGLSGPMLKARILEVTRQLGVDDRLNDFAEKLSGGLKRRVEIAKSMLHAPQILLLDEPSTGLDPGARHDLWNILRQLNTTAGVTILVTTHLMEEADHCSHLGILDAGKLIAQGTPYELRGQVGGDSVTITTDNPVQLAEKIRTQLNVASTVMGGAIRIEHLEGHQLIGQLATTFPDEFRSLTLGKPSLEDVFISLTGRTLTKETGEDA